VIRRLVLNPGIPKVNKTAMYLIVFRNARYYHRGLWPSRADALRNADDLPAEGLEIKRCWVAVER
jgi:hypothetical protein